MFTFHEKPSRSVDESRDNAITVFNKDGEPITADQRSQLLMRLNQLGGLDPDDPLWSDVRSGSDLRVAEMLENHTEPNDVTDSLRRLAGAVIRRLVADQPKARTVHARVDRFDEPQLRKHTLSFQTRTITGELNLGGFLEDTAHGQFVRVTFEPEPIGK